MVTVLRAAASSGVSGGRAKREVPQLRQNFTGGAHTLPHDGQRRSSAAPHSPQNADPTGLACWHAGQFMVVVAEDAQYRPLATQGRGSHPGVNGCQRPTAQRLRGV
jgi:hypothetical protein